jgi:hypothetical protein
VVHLFLTGFLPGWLSAIGWQVYLAGVCFMVGSVIQGLIALNVPDYVWHNWHGTLLTIAAIVFSIAFNTVLSVQLPLVEGVVLILHFAGFFAIIIPLWVMAPRATAHTALLEFSNNGGWSSTGLSAMIGLTSPLSVLIGYDCSVHMCKFDVYTHRRTTDHCTQPKRFVMLPSPCPRPSCGRSLSTPSSASSWP